MLKKALSIILLNTLSFSALAQNKEIFSRRNYVETPLVQICTMPLPISPSVRVNRLFLGMKHVYLRIDDKTYGTPYTIDRKYMGGDAYLYTEDLFVEKMNAQGEKCYDVFHKEAQSEELFLRKSSCIANKLSKVDDVENIEKKWWPVFDYHFLENNCASMAKYLIDCMDGYTTKSVNFGVGDNVPPTKEAKLMSIDNGQIITTQATYGSICKKAVSECDEELGIY